jgi:poly-gamma-glutamate synthesis protein (capsule biosynthesis protein)
VLNAGRQRVALLAFNAVADPADQPNEGSDWGRARLDDAALQRVQQARHDADAVVVMVHWGAEYAATPTAAQHEWARKLVGAGADVIIGAHPHVLQPVEQVESNGHSGIVAYSLGNFIFDQSFRQETSTGAVLRVLLDEHGVALVAAAPVEIVAGQPRPLALDTEIARTALASLGMPETPTLQAWRWDGKAAEPIQTPSDLRLPPRPTKINVDLRGDGQPLRATLDSQGHIEVRDNNAVVWQNEEPNWRVTRMDSGDPNDDGRIELVLLLWKPDEHGVLRAHPFLMGWRGGHYRIIWGGSATATPIQDLAVGDLDGDGRQELVVLEGGAQPGDAATNISVWHWHGWGFEREWTSAAGQWRDLALVDVSGDGRLDIVAHDVMTR